MNSVNNDETTDLFGMELKYDQVDAGLGNTALYNGNIGGIKWSSYPGLTNVKEKGYTFTYDPMNRITGSTFKENTTSWTALGSGKNAETGLAYDLNGNVLSLTRNDKRATGTMDILAYDYGAAGATSNKLLKVSDGGDDYTGFLDGTNSGNDYTYDGNGNMLTDENKGLTSAIAYNFLNLPELVTRGGNSARYIYDAGGRKLNQTLTLGSVNKRTDYCGEFQYENDVLQFVNHEEGRIVTSANTLVHKNTCEATTGLTASVSTLAVVTQNGQTYVRVTANTAGSNRGMSNLGVSITAYAGEVYRIRFKGYTTGANGGYINIKLGGTSTS